MNSAVMFSTGKDDWQTPPELFDLWDASYDGFSLDVAALESNRMVKAYLGPDHDVPSYRDALNVDWRSCCALMGKPPICWCNPPYSRGLQGKFIAKAAVESIEGTTTVMLLPARTDTKAFHSHIWNLDTHRPYKGVEVAFLRGRLRFVGAPAPAPFPSMIVVFQGAK